MNSSNNSSQTKLDDEFNDFYFSFPIKDLINSNCKILNGKNLSKKDTFDLDDENFGNSINHSTQNTVNNQDEIKNEKNHCNLNENKKKLTKYATNENLEPMVKLINTEIAVNDLLNSAESSYLLHKKSNKINSSLDDENFLNLEIKKNIIDNCIQDLFLENQANPLNLNQKDLNKKKFEEVLQEVNFSEKKFLNTNNVNLKKSKSEDNLRNLNENTKSNSYISSLNDLNLISDLEEKKKKLKSEVIINHCEKIYANLNSTDNLVKINSHVNEKINSKIISDSIQLIKPSSQKKNTSSDIDKKEKKDLIESNQTFTVLNYNFSSSCEAEHIFLNEEDLSEVDTDNIEEEPNSFDKNFSDSKQNDIEDKTNKLIINKNNKDKKILIDTKENFPKMTTILSPSSNIDEQCHQQNLNQFNFNKISFNNKMKTDDDIMKPLKSLLKKTNSQNQDMCLDKKKRRVKFADTMMVFCDDWPEEIMPQIIALKSPSEFNLVEIAAQGYMFEPPVEYKDFLPFDPPPDYRDYINSKEVSDFNFSNLPNHALLKMYENENNSENISENTLDKFDLNNDMYLKLDYNNLNFETDSKNLSNLVEDESEEDNVQIDTYKDMILNDNDEMLEEDAIIGVLKEDEILQAIGSQIDSFDKNILKEECSDIKQNFETYKSNNNESLKMNNKLNNECTPGSIIILNKNGNLNCQPIQIITPDNSDIAFPNIEEYVSSPNGSLQDLASDSSITSQDTIIMMTNAILTDNSNSINEVIDTRKEINKNNQDSKKTDLVTSKESDTSEIVLNLENTFKENQNKFKLENEQIIFDSSSNKYEKDLILKNENSLDKNTSLIDDKDSSNSDTIKDLQINFEESNADSRRDSDSILQDSSIENSFELNNCAEKKSVSVSEIRKSFERKFSFNSEENTFNKSLTKDSSTESDEQKNLSLNEAGLPSNNTNMSFQKNDLFQNLPNCAIDSNLSSETTFLNENEFLNQNWQNKSMIVEYTSEPKTLLPSKRISLNNVNHQKPIIQQPIIQQSIIQQSVIQQPVITQPVIQNQVQQQQLLQSNLNLTNLPSTNLQIKLPIQQQQSENSNQLSSQLVDKQTNFPPNCTTSQNQIKVQTNTQSTNIKTIEDKNPIFQTLPIKFATNKNLRTHLVGDKVFLNQQSNTNSLPGQSKPQFILIHSYPNNGNLEQNGTTLTHLSNQKAFAIKIHHSQIAHQKLNNNKPSILVNNIQGKLVSATSTLSPSATIVQSNSILNHGSFIQQAFLKATNKEFVSNFPNASEIRRRDGLNAFPNVWKQSPNSDSFPTSPPVKNQANKSLNSSNSNKDELESFVQQDIQRIERIKKRYTTNEDDEDPTFGFARRPSVKGIKNKSNHTTELIKQLQKNQQIHQQNSQFKPNIILTTTAQPNQKINLQSPQIVLTSHLLTQAKQKNDNSVPLQVVSGQQPQTLKISSQAIPIIQKDQNSQKHVYLIPNQFVPGFQQRLLQAGATLPRSHHPHSAQLQTPKSNQINPQQTPTSESNNKSIPNQLLIPSANSNQNISRPSSALGDAIVKDQNKLIDLSNVKQSQIIYHHNQNTNEVKPINLQNRVIINPATNTNNTLQYKTVSMPNVALIKSGNQQITLLTTNKDKLLQQIHQQKVQLVQNQQAQQQQQIQQQQIQQQKIQQQQIQQQQLQQQKILIQKNQHEPNKEFNSPKHLISSAINGKSNLNKKTSISISSSSSSTNSSNIINTCNKNIANFDLVKDTAKRLSTNNASSTPTGNTTLRGAKITPIIASNSKTTEDANKTKFKTVNSKDGVIFYSMNI